MRQSIRRSKGCQICRERRVKCDEREPTCGQCRRLGRQCPGPRGTTVFIDETPRFDGERRPSGSQSTSKSPSNSPNPSSSSGKAASITDLTTLTSAQDSASTSSLSATKRWHLDLPIEVYYVSLMVNKFRLRNPGAGPGFAWLRLGLDERLPEPSLSHLFTCNLAQTFFAHYYHLPEVMAKSQAEYGKHLLMLKKELNIPGSINNPTMFRGIMAAVMYEFIAMTSPHAWRTHVLALSKIMESRGPDAYKPLPERGGFSFCRALVIGDATQRRTRTFLERPEWKITGLWRLPNALQDALSDVQVEMPGLLEDYDNISTGSLSPGTKSSALSSILDRVIAQINLLFNWRWWWERQNRDSPWLVPCSPSSLVPRDHLTRQPLFPTLIYFRHFNHVHEIARYNSTLTILFDLAHTICGDDSYLAKVDRSVPTDLQHTTHRSPLCLPSDPELSVYTAIGEHVRSIEYALSEEEFVATSGLFLLLGLNLTYKALPIDDPLTGWIRRICRQIGTLSGFNVGVKFKPAETVTKEMHWSRFYLAGSDG